VNGIVAFAPASSWEFVISSRPRAAASAVGKRERSVRDRRFALRSAPVGPELETDDFVRGVPGDVERVADPEQAVPEQEIGIGNGDLGDRSRRDIDPEELACVRLYDKKCLAVGRDDDPVQVDAERSLSG